MPPAGESWQRDSWRDTRHSLPTLLADLATICRNTVHIGTAEHTFTRLTTPTPLQAHTLELLDVKLHQ